MHEFIARVMVAWQGLISVVLANSIVALVIFFVGFIIGRVLGKIVEKILKEAELNWIVGKALKKKLPLAEGIAKESNYKKIYVVSGIGVKKYYIKKKSRNVLWYICDGCDMLLPLQ